MYSKKTAGCIMNREGSYTSAYCHSGRTDAGGGHRDLVSRALTADDEQGIRYGTDDGGSFFACSAGDSTKLKENQISLNQHQFDAMISFSYQYGQNWWFIEPEKEMTRFLKRGKGIYDPEEAMEIFKMHYSTKRREIEANVFINGY